ncbi:MAG: restriction endonuclease [Planctomycetes bacterium]|nr:restriction endonuclease [Planctomycetota bacterium]MCG2682125.1 hypothetical protein [Planctomycetales bacterium]
MGLTQTQKAMVEKARAAGGSGQAIPLSDDACVCLIGIIARDLGLSDHFPELPSDLPPFFDQREPGSLNISGVEFLPLMERLVKLNPDSDTFFSCLANLHKRRLKYERILQTQPIPTIEQVGPRGLLQFGTISATTLTGLLFWRKWFFDIDNRAGQETGYLFEPIIAHAIGGVPFSAKASPVRRAGDSRKGRQVDCIRQQKAYEFKIRVTIASSGQGRWQEELDFPVDCRQSRYTPVLVVLDATPNPKLDQLEAAFLRQQGEVYKGESAWEHLESVAGPTMGLFLEKYVRDPIQALLNKVSDCLPEFVARMDKDGITLSVAGESMLIRRTLGAADDEVQELPDDASDQIPGP